MEDSVKYNIKLGPASSFNKLPALITEDDNLYFLVRNQGEYQLLSSVCPHMGGRVSRNESCFKCPNHDWQFELDTGKGINSPSSALYSYPVKELNGQLWAELPRPVRSTVTLARPQKHSPDVKIQLHAHACLEISYNGFSILTDPWLCGPAFLGSWIQYPPPVVDVNSLRPDAIWITHEHSDHFHEPTLTKFHRSTPIYVPDFPNQRMVDRLKEMDFTDVRPLKFGETYELTNNVNLTCFEPGGFWNDSIGLLEVDGFRILNLNDAGFNQRIARQIQPVDVIAFQYSSGASSYPIVWDHLTKSEKLKIIDSRHGGRLSMLEQAFELYGGEYFIPFAADFALWHPAHREYLEMLRKIQRPEVTNSLERIGVKVLDLMPGDYWESRSRNIQRHSSTPRFPDKRSDMLQYVDENFDTKIFQEHHPSIEYPTREELSQYFQRLNDCAEIIFCDDIKVILRTLSLEGEATADADFCFQITEGKLEILEQIDPAFDLLISLPPGILKRIVTENMSWDEAHIGYWCRFDRKTDVYNAGFWRLLQSPYYNRPAHLTATENASISKDSVVAGLLENFGQQADRILRRHGLYCTDCDHSTACSIALGAKDHGIEKADVDHLVRELKQVLELDRIE